MLAVAMLGAFNQQNPGVLVAAMVEPLSIEWHILVSHRVADRNISEGVGEVTALF